jgi:uncharacterized protein YjiK
MTIKRADLPGAILAICMAMPGAGAAEEGVLQRFSLKANSVEQWRLPDRLDEISGLALSPDGRLFAVDDEKAVIYELDYVEGRIIKKFTLGKPVLRGDFEGIAYLDARIWLTTSVGDIYSAPEGEDGERVPYEHYQTDLASRCEIEGMAAAEDDLYLICKSMRKKSTNNLAIYRWSVSKQQLRVGKTVLIPEQAIRRSLRSDRFNPSGLAFVPGHDSLLIVASHQQAIVEMGLDGELISARYFPLASRHVQPEGIEITRDARLLIADEGRNRRARLAVYRQQEDRD